MGRTFQRVISNRSLIIGGVLVGTVVFMAAAAPYIVGYDPVTTDFGNVRHAPSLAHWFGTDELGRDVFSRVVYGARSSLMAGIVATAIAVVIGLFFGTIAGFVGGLVDGVISRITEAMFAIPFLILAIALASFLGPSLRNVMIAIGIAASPFFIRLIRAEVMVAKASDYVLSAQSIGANKLWIVLIHIFPNIVAPIIVQATIQIAAAIIAEASLSFLGLGLQPPSPAWGSMLNTGKNFMVQAPWMSIYPGLGIFVAVCGFNLFGDGLRDVLDPRQL